MKPFRFKLKTVLEVRVNEEAQAGEVYAQAQAHLEEVLSFKRSVEEAVEGNLTACQQAFAGHQAATGTLAHLQTALRELRGQLSQLEPVVAERQTETDAKWQELLTARRRREALEKMRDEQQAAHDRELARTEQQAIDEMVLLREAGGFAAKR